MIRDKYAVRLAPEQREELQNLILLKSDDGWAAPKEALVARWTGPCGTGARSTDIGSWTTGAKPTSSRWPAVQRRRATTTTLRLLAGKVVELGLASSMSHEGVRKRLKKTFSSRGRSRSGASPR